MGAEREGICDDGGGLTFYQEERLECIIPQRQHSARTLNELHCTI